MALSVTQAQTDMPTVIKKLNEAYQANSNMSVTTTYKMFPNYTTTTAAQTLTGNLKKKGEQMSYKLENVERLESLHRRIMVNHDSKTVIVQANDVERKTYVMDIELEKFLNKKTIGQVIDQGTQLLLTIPVKLPDVEKVDMYINKTTFLINKIVVYYRQAVRFNAADENTPKEKPRMEIAFQINLNPTFANNEFAETKFIKVNSGVVKLNTTLTGYQLVNFDKD
jgi:predicted RNase H-related nuclease YkuK (DUF458 family)